MAKERLVGLGIKNYPLISMDLKGVPGNIMSDEHGLVLATSLTPSPGVNIQDQVYGRLIRNISPRSLWREATKELYARDIRGKVASRFAVYGMLGAPGFGKTYHFNHIGSLLHDKGPIMIDCSNLDMRELFEVVILDSGSVEKEKADIDAKIALYNMGLEPPKAITAESLELLEKLAGPAFYRDGDGKVSVDWAAVRPPSSLATDEDMERASRTFTSILQQVCRNEKIKTSSSMSLGLRKVDGPLVKSLDPGSPDYARGIILDELNRALPGTVSNLFDTLDALNSEARMTFTVRGAQGREVRVDKKEMPGNWYLRFTGNQSIANMDSRQFSAPFLSRVVPHMNLLTIPSYTAQDYADMVSSHVLGVPGTFIEDAFSMNEAPERELVGLLKTFRTIGLTEQQKQAIPYGQWDDIENARNINEFSRYLGSMFFAMNEIFKGRGKEIDEMELDPQYVNLLAESSVDYRFIVRVLNDADNLRPVIRQQKIPASMIGNRESQLRMPAQRDMRGTRAGNLVELIKEWADKVIEPPDARDRRIDPEQAGKMKAHLNSLYSQFGIDEKVLHEATPKEVPLIVHLYTPDENSTQRSSLRLQRLIHKRLQEKHGESFSQKPEEVLPMRAAMATVAALRQTLQGGNGLGHLGKDVSQIFVVNDDRKAASAKPLKTALLLSLLNLGEKEKPGPEALLPLEDFIAGFSVPDVARVNAPALWNRFFTSHITPRDSVKKLSRIWEGHPGENVWATAVTVRRGDEPSYLYVIHKRKEDKTLMVGEAIPEYLNEGLRKSGISYIDRQKGADVFVSLEHLLTAAEQFDVSRALHTLVGVFPPKEQGLSDGLVNLLLHEGGPRNGAETYAVLAADVERPARKFPNSEELKKAVLAQMQGKSGKEMS